MSIIGRIKKALPIAGAPQPRPAAPPVARYSEPEPVSARGGTPPLEFIETLVKSNPIVIFMKGSPTAPQCGFSARASSILLSYGHPLTHFNVFEDDGVRESVKQYSSWPTIPQIYVGGEFLGGSDILGQMHENGELKEAIDAAFASN